MLAKANLKVLIVDDSITIRELMKQQLKELGVCCFETAETGIEALELFQISNPNLVFLDINMPKMNGVEALSKMMVINPKAYIIILSSLCTKEKVNETMQCGAKNFFMKPIDDKKMEHILLEASQLF